MFMVWGYFQQKQSTVLLVSYLQGLVGGAGNLILCFHDGFLFYLLCIWEKSYRVLFFIGNIFTVLFLLVLFSGKVICIQGGLLIFSHALDFLGDYMGSGLLFSVFVCFREDTTCSFLFLVFWFGIYGDSGKKWVDFGTSLVLIDVGNIVTGHGYYYG